MVYERMMKSKSDVWKKHSIVVQTEYALMDLRSTNQKSRIYHFVIQYKIRIWSLPSRLWLEEVYKISKHNELMTPLEKNNIQEEQPKIMRLLIAKVC